MGKHWEKSEINELVEWVDGSTEVHSVSEAVREYVEVSGTHRTVSALYNMYWKVKNGTVAPKVLSEDQPVAPVSMTKKTQLAEQLMEIVNVITSLFEENDSLRNKVAELEQVHQDYEIMSRILKQARDSVVDHKRSSFRMDKNGNLERIE